MPNELTQAEIHVLGYLGMNGGLKAGGFTCSLIEAIFHADWINTTKLYSVYPEYVDAVKAWTEGDLAQRSGNG